MSMKKIYLNTLITTLVVVALFSIWHVWSQRKNSFDHHIMIGFVYVSDESTPYTNNFIHGQIAIENQFGNAVTLLVKNNVPEGDEEERIRELAEAGCDIIFTTSYGYEDSVKKIAGEYPNIQFCQATGTNANEAPFYKNYHTFMGEIYQGRYVAGIVAGMKLEELIKENKITPEEAKVGYVAAYPYAEVISGYTAFLLGIRSVVPEATMTVKYVDTWSSYSLEKKCAKQLIDEGCIIISQHSDTIGPAVACEETASSQNVFHVGYNQSMIDIAPTTSLISSRINWTPYMVAAVEAVLSNKKIEKYVKGHVYGNDVGAGFEENWVAMYELNELIAAEGTQEKIDESKRAFINDKCQVFIGDYIGVNPNDETDTYDLKKGYIENEKSSAPTFGYVLKDVIKIEAFNE